MNEFRRQGIRRMNVFVSDDSWTFNVNIVYRPKVFCLLKNIQINRSFSDQEEKN